jgi:hypothetical protein
MDLDLSCPVIAACSPPVLLRGLWFRLSHGISLVLLLYVCAFVLRMWRARRTPELSLLAVSVVSIGAAGAHDWMAYSLFRIGPRATLGLPFEQSLLLVPYAAPLVFFTLAWHLARRFAEALDAAERWSAERERIYGDLHDDLGARLLSLVIGAESPRQADLARTALADLRDVVSRSASRAAGEPAALVDLLGDWRAEIEQRAAAAGLHLTWAQEPEEPALALSPDDALNLGRILREAVTNVLRHASASRLSVRAAVRGRRGSAARSNCATRPRAAPGWRCAWRSGRRDPGEDEDGDLPALGGPPRFAGVAEEGAGRQLPGHRDHDRGHAQGGAALARGPPGPGPGAHRSGAARWQRRGAARRDGGSPGVAY